MHDFITAYTSHQRVLGYSERTIGRREWSLRLWVEHLDIHGVTLTGATVEHLEGFLARWPAPQSRYSVRSDVHQLYRFIARRRLAACADPTDELDPPKVPRRDASPIPAADVRRLLDVVSGSDRLIVMLAAHAGLRCFEIAAVRGEDIDLGGRWLTVPHGKGGHRAVVPVSVRLAVELARWPRHGLLLPYRSGNAVGNRIRLLLRRHGITGRPHDLRHSFATEAAARSNGNIMLVSKLMRHAEIATTMRYVQIDRSGHDVVDGLYGEAA